jgi:hypothetical protein
MTSLALKIQRRANIEKRLALLKIISAFKKIDPKDTLIICSDPRGGSTWLAEIIKKIPQTAMIWEPLNTAEVQEFRNLDFGIRQYIPSEHHWPEARKMFEKTFKGKIINEFTTQFLSVSEYLNAKHLLIKFCRANALLPWLVENFKFNFQPILLIRHPFSVVASQLNHRGWKSRTQKFQFHEGPFSEFYDKHEIYLKTLGTNEERLVAQWCMSNLSTLRNIKNNQAWITVFYEDLLKDTKTELGRIQNRWQLNFPESLFENHTMASKTSVNFDENSKSQLSKWQSSFRKDQIKKLMAVLSYFECEFYNDGHMPLIQLS